MADNYIHVMICSDKNEFIGVFAVMNSIFTNTNKKDQLYFHITVDDGESSYFNRQLSLVRSKWPWPFNIEVKEFPPNEFLKENICVKNPDQNYVKYISNIMNFSRFYLAELYPHLEKVIYLDTDLIIRGDIADLYQEVRLDKHIFAAAPRPNFIVPDFNANVDAKSIASKEIDFSKASFNAGVYITNLKAWNQQNILSEIKDIMVKHKNSKEPLFTLGTQPILNIIFYEAFEHFDPCWNCTGLGHMQNLEITENIKKAKILHWSGAAKPWLKTGFYKDHWSKYNIMGPLIKIDSYLNFLSFLSLSYNKNNDSTCFYFDFDTKNRKIIEPDDNYYQNYDNVILTCYFNMKIDQHHECQQAPDDYNYIKPWYDSMKNLGMHGIIFYDCLSEKFIETYQTDKIIFKKCIYGDYSLNDERFYIYYLYLLKNPYKKVFMTDVRDVTIKKNPFELVEDKEKIYIGTEEPKILSHHEWFVLKTNDLFTELEKQYQEIANIKSSFLEMRCVNAGVIGGYYELIMFFLKNMINIFNQINNGRNNNMMVVNYVIYMIMSYDYDRHVMSKYPLTSEFNKYQIDSDAYIVHK